MSIQLQQIETDSRDAARRLSTEITSLKYSALEREFIETTWLLLHDVIAKLKLLNTE